MKPSVLFIEDDKDQVVLYKTKFELEGFDFLFAYNGAEGLTTAKQKQPCLIFLDIILLEMSGMEILKQLKKETKTKNIPIVLLTNLSNNSSRDEGKKLGAIGYVIKTDISLKELVRMAKEIIKS